MAYATPTTYAEFIALIDGITWTSDCNQQKAKWLDLIARLEAYILGIQALLPIQLHLVQDEQPSLNDWQTAWEKAGYTLPISGNVRGLHETRTLETREVAEYIWYDGQMHHMRARWFQGSNEITSPFPYVATTALGTSEAKLMDIPISMKAAGWINFQTQVSVIYTTTDTAVRWRTSQESASSTYSLLKTRISSLVQLYPGMTHTRLEYVPTVRQSSAFNGNLEVWVWKEASTATFGNQDTLQFVDYIPGHVEMIYD